MSDRENYGARDMARDTARLLRFYSRLPVPRLPFETDPHQAPDFTDAPVVLPFVGAIIGCIGGLTLWVSAQFGVGAAASAILGLTALVIATGAFHEDGLADTADGFWGGATVERRLEIMKDSRIGTYGGAALALSLLLRAAILAELTARGGPGLAATLMIGAAALSRCCGLTPLTFLPPARNDGASALVGRPGRTVYAIALGVATVLALALANLHGLIWAAIPATALAIAVAAGMTWLSKKKIGGHTGDVAGAAQQLSEIAFLIALIGSV
jgi:adenosylcobinamide-GDP ribazoletransferase